MLVNATDSGPSSSTGTHVADGSVVVVTLGFKPLYLRIWDGNGAFSADATGAQPTGSALEDVNAATTQQIAVGSNGIIFTASGFTIGTDANLNNPGHTYYWYATR